LGVSKFFGDRDVDLHLDVQLLHYARTSYLSYSLEEVLGCLVGLVRSNAVTSSCDSPQMAHECPLELSLHVICYAAVADELKRAIGNGPAAISVFLDSSM
jgi:hypothetical protein